MKRSVIYSIVALLVVTLLIVAVVAIWLAVLFNSFYFGIVGQALLVSMIVLLVLASYAN
jgi:hypothetical protein